MRRQIHRALALGAALCLAAAGAAAQQGKGTPELWVVRVKPGRILFEVDGIPVSVAREALGLAAAKLPVKTRFIERIAE